MTGKIVKSFLWIFVLGLGAGFEGNSPAPIAGFKNFELVESAPVETTMDDWEKSYFHNARNIGVFVENKSINKILKKIYLKNWNSSYSYLIKPEIEYVPPKIGEFAASPLPSKTR